MLIIKRSTHKSATLNQQFYEELLYIMGLEEKNSIIRPNRVQGAIVTQLMDDHDVPEDEAFSLTTTWINRLLFIKLLEGLLRGYLEDKQLDLLQCASFAELKELFFSVLAKPIEERSAANRKRFQHHPYLNSSLFDKTEEEHCHLISILHNDNLQIYRGSTLISGQRNGAKPLLSYLLEFLASYRFSNDQKDSERLISAPVLGLIFEKLNGHRDGAVYTPSAITRR
ncbi:MAG: restriction endonuclease, partial [Bacteroidetes bacterium]